MVEGCQRPLWVGDKGGGRTRGGYEWSGGDALLAGEWQREQEE